MSSFDEAQGLSPVETQPSGSENVGRTSSALRASLTGASVWAWGHTGYLLEIAGGKVATEHGLNPWAAAAAVAITATAETYAVSHLAERGIGDFTVEKSNRPLVRKIQGSSTLSLGLSTWNGAPSGVALDKVFNRQVTMRRRLGHAAPYGLFVGFWASPTPPSEWVTHTVSQVPEFVGHEVAQHPMPSGLVGAVALAAIGAKYRSRRATRTRE